MSFSLKKTSIKYEFFFTLSKRNIYYSANDQDVHVLDALPLKRVASIKLFSIADSENAACFQIIDSEDISNWKVCASKLSVKLIWVCGIKKALNINSSECEEGYQDKPEPTVVVKTINQPILLIAEPSRQCNEKWNYFKDGDDWECECKEGKEQSPIDLPHPSVAEESPAKPIFQYDQSGLESKNMENNKDETMSVQYEENMLQIENNISSFGKVITLDGRVYRAEKIVIHTPSEHTIEGKRYDMELQIIHYGQTTGDLAKQVVVSVLFEKKAGAYNKFIDDLDFFNLPNPIYQRALLSTGLFVPKLFYDSSSEEIPIMKPMSFYTYQGSVSFPPCSERTINYVFSKPIPLSTTALKLFKEAIRLPDLKDSSGNIAINTHEPKSNRKTQPLNGRKIFFYDHVKYCGEYPEPPKKQEALPAGHYEKVKSKMTQYLYVGSEKPSGLPNAFVVSEKEAKGN